MNAAETLDMWHDLIDSSEEVVEIRGPIYEQFHRRLQEEDWDDMPELILVEGPAGGGKTWGLAAWMDGVCRKYPGTPCLVLREKRVDLTTSWMVTFEDEILDPDDPTSAYVLAGPSRETRRVYHYPADSRTGLQSTITVGGLNQWERFRSQQFLIIWIVEGSEASRSNVQGVVRALRPARLTRKARRLMRRLEKRMNAAFPKRLLIIDTNPDAWEHHLNQAAIKGIFHREIVLLKHNPCMWDWDNDVPTEEGVAYIRRLTQGTDGHVYERLVDGKWSSAEGAMFPMWNPRINMFSYRLDWVEGKWPVLTFTPTHPVLGESVQLVDIIAAVDWGTRNAGALGVFGVDQQGRVYLLHEVYMTERDIDWWAARAVEAFVRFRMTKIVCDSDKPDNIHMFNKALHRAFNKWLGDYKRSTSRADRETGLPRDGGAARIARATKKNTKASSHKTNWDILRWAMGTDETGIPKLFMALSSLSHAPDPHLARRGIPLKTSMEVTAARWAPHDEGKAAGLPREDIDGRCQDHGLTMTSYALVEFFGRDLLDNPVAEAELRPRPGSWDAVFDMKEVDAVLETLGEAGSGFTDPLDAIYSAPEDEEGWL